MSKVDDNDIKKTELKVSAAFSQLVSVRLIYLLFVLLPRDLISEMF